MAQFVLVKQSSMFMDVAERVDENVMKPVCRVNRHSKGPYNLQLILAAPRMRDLLQAIVSDLPNNRDWLDPSIEREAVELLAALKWHDKGSQQTVVPRSRNDAVMPSDKMTPLVEVFHTGNDGEWHIIGFSGNVCGGLFEYIEQEFKDEQEWWKEQLSSGPGSYLFEAEFVAEQRDDFGRIELPSYWCLTRVAFRACEHSGEPNDSQPVIVNADESEPENEGWGYGHGDSFFPCYGDGDKGRSGAERECRRELSYLGEPLYVQKWTASGESRIPLGERFML